MWSRRRQDLNALFFFALGTGFGTVVSHLSLVRTITSPQCPTDEILPLPSTARPPTAPPREAIFPRSIQNLVASTSRVLRSDFVRAFDVGMGIDGPIRGNTEVFLLYNGEHALPTGFDAEKDNGKQLALVEATENCHQVKVVMIDPRPPEARTPHHHCLAVMGQWESFHVHRFQRNNETHSSFEYTAARHPNPPSPDLVEASDAYMADYLKNRRGFLEQLRPLAAQAAGKDTGPIAIVVANWAQAKFLLNLVCVARHRQIGTSSILLFAADTKTQTLAKALNLTVFYNESLLQDFTSAGQMYWDYKDAKYGRSMMLKVYPVDLVSRLGYDIIYTDVDMVWFQNPLHYFATRAKPGFDIYFQHDGDHHPDKFAPMAANTGVFFSRNNNRTRYFWSSLVKLGDIVLHTNSHQAAVSTLLNEHTNLRGLRVQVLAEDSSLFLSTFS